MKIGDSVRHPSRGTGTVATLIYSPLRPDRATKAWVEFPHVGFGNCTQRFLCFVDDLVIVPKPVAPDRPTLKVVEHEPVVA